MSKKPKEQEITEAQKDKMVEHSLNALQDLFNKAVDMGFDPMVGLVMAKCVNKFADQTLDAMWRKTNLTDEQIKFNQDSAQRLADHLTDGFVLEPTMSSVKQEHVNVITDPRLRVVPKPEDLQ